MEGEFYSRAAALLQYAHRGSRLADRHRRRSAARDRAGAELRRAGPRGQQPFGRQQPVHRPADDDDADLAGALVLARALVLEFVLEQLGWQFVKLERDSGELGTCSVPDHSERGLRRGRCR